MNMNKEQILYLKKQGFFWYMDKSTFLSFFSYVNHYFTPQDTSSGFDMEKIDYAEISHDDLSELSNIFAGYLNDNQTLSLMPLNNPATLWGSVFELIIYEQTGEVCTPRKIVMGPCFQNMQKQCH